MNLMSSSLILLTVSLYQVQAGKWDPKKCSNSYFSNMWTATGEVPNKLPQVPPQPLYMRYNSKTVFPNDTFTTEDMLNIPDMKWRTERGSLYTIIMVDFGIKRLGGQKYFHWLVANVPGPIYGSTIYSADEVQEYIAPFGATSEVPGTINRDIDGSPVHDIVTLVYKQTTGQVNMADERQSGCEGILTKRIGDHAALAEKYNLELVAGTFFYTTYTAVTEDFICRFTECLGEPFLGITDGPACLK